MTKKVVLFGTGQDLYKCIGVLREQGIEHYCFTDNNSSKWGTLLDGKKIIPPTELIRIDCQIVITTSNYKMQIQNQLNAMGLGDRVLDFSSIFRKYIDRKLSEYQVSKAKVHKQKCVLVDAFTGSGWDGDAQYACIIASCLDKRGYNTHVYAKESLIKYSEDIEKLIGRYEQRREAYWETVLPIIRDMEQRLPFVLIANSLDYVMVAAYVLKQRYPDLVRIISVIHNDSYMLYERQVQWQNEIEKYICISARIRKNLEDEWKIPPNKLYYRVNPCIIEMEGLVEFNPVSEWQGPVRIGWGGRLYSAQKRADLLPELIEKLEEKKIDYQLEIAGDGPCYAMIETYIQQNDLKERVHLLGRLEPGSMKDFWQRQQVYINISEWEGCCLAMLEAMKCGAVPVVTDVSGTEELIIDGQTGFKAGIGDIEQIANKIAYLASHSEKRKIMSRHAREMVEECCELNQYIDFIEELIK